MLILLHQKKAQASLPTKGRRGGGILSIKLIRLAKQANDYIERRRYC